MTIVWWAGVAVLGGLGAVLRFMLDRAVARRAARSLPLGTLAVNITGTVALGLLTGLALSPHAMLWAATAFLGSYTTFSTWMLETQRLAEERQGQTATVNIVVSVVAGLGAAALGQWITGGFA